MKNIAVLFTTILVIVGACAETNGPVGGGSNEVESEEFEIHVVERSDRQFEEIKTQVEYPFFSHVILDKGYRVIYREAAHFQAKKNDSGEIVDMTVIPCRLIDGEQSVAMIYYMKSEEGYVVTAAEYFEDEGYDIPHILDHDAYMLMSGAGVRGIYGIDAMSQDDISTQFWKCVVKRFGAGCIGCALKCYLSGPAWGACATACCAGTAVVAIISCAFTVYGW